MQRQADYLGAAITEAFASRKKKVDKPKRAARRLWFRVSLAVWSVAAVAGGIRIVLWALQSRGYPTP